MSKKFVYVPRFRKVMEDANIKENELSGPVIQRMDALSTLILHTSKLSEGGADPETIESMEKNPNIPQLFRDIFKNAYLPYRDPETLKLFLKTIGEFEYTHSEKLGDALE